MSKRRRDWCRHFTGVQNDACAIGVRYADVRVVPEGGGMYQFPCLLDTATCPSVSVYTAEELAEQERETAKAILGFTKARAAIVEHGQASGILDCPVCGKGQLGYSKAASNGHIHAACSTPGCVRWME